MGFAFMLIIILFSIFVFIFLKRNLGTLGDPSFQSRFNSLYLNINTEKPLAHYLPLIFIFRRFIMGIIVSFCDNHQSAQFLFMTFSSFAIIIYLVKVRPMVSLQLNAIEIINEVILYGCTTLICGMTEYQSEPSEGMSEK